MRRLESIKGVPLSSGPFAKIFNFCQCNYGMVVLCLQKIARSVASLFLPTRHFARIVEYLSTPINTHSSGWMIMSFLISFLWFRINNNPIFPLGFIGALLIALWSADIDKTLGKEPLLNYSLILSSIGMIIGFIVR